MFIIVCSWDPIIARFMKKCLRFKTRKWRRPFVFFQRCHRWASGATVVVMSKTAGIYIIFAFSQLVALFRRLHRSYTSVACDIGDMFWTYNVCFLQLPDGCFSCTMIRTDTFIMLVMVFSHIGLVCLNFRFRLLLR